MEDRQLDLRREARAAAAAHDRDRLEQTGLAALEGGFDLMGRLEIAIFCRDGGLSELAERVFEAVIAASPRSPFAYYELAFIRRQEGRHDLAAAVLETGIRASGGDRRLRLFLGHMLHSVGAHEEADAELCRIVPATAQEAAQLGILVEFGQYLRDHPRGAALFRLHCLKRSRAHLDTEGVAARIDRARAERRPFAMIRLGDGEGAWMRMAPDEEHAYRRLYRAARGEFASIWYGGAFDAETNGFAELAAGVADLTAESDVVGIPYQAWLQHEYAIASTRGIPSLVNLLRALRDGAYGEATAFCEQGVHRDLHLSGALARILGEEKRIGLVSCHPELPDRLADHFGLDEVEFHRVPGEVGRAAFITGAGELGVHYPEAFRATDAALARPHDGRVFLVAAGILGKFYAITIKRNGGIALDVGSLVDAWLRRRTRPDYSDRLALPAAPAECLPAAPAECVHMADPIRT